MDWHFQGATKHQMSDFYIQTLAKIVVKEEAKKKSTKGILDSAVRLLRRPQTSLKACQVFFLCSQIAFSPENKDYGDESFRDNVKFGHNSKVSVLGKGQVLIKTPRITSKLLQMFCLFQI